MSRYPCPCCGYLVFQEPPGSYDICPICFWEDDALQLEFATTLAGGANHVTLLDGQQIFREHGACEEGLIAYVRPPGPFDRRDPTWRPIDPARDWFPVWDDPGRVRAPEDDESLYYWRETFWALDRAT